MPLFWGLFYVFHFKASRTPPQRFFLSKCLYITHCRKTAEFQSKTGQYSQFSKQQKHSTDPEKWAKFGKISHFSVFTPIFPRKNRFSADFPEIPGFFQEFAIVAGKSLAFLQKSLAFEKVEKSLVFLGFSHSRWPYSRQKSRHSR